MRRILVVLAVAVLAVVAVVALRGGGGGGSDEKQVRATLAEFNRASDQKDYAAICGHILAPNLLDQMRQIKLPCTVALARSTLGSVRSPTLAVKRVRITGATALADVQSGAAQETPLSGTIELVKVGGLWQIRSLGGQPAKTKP